MVSFAHGASLVRAAGSKPMTVPSRWISRSRGAPAGGTVTTWMRSGGTAFDQTARIAPRSCRIQKPRAGLVPARAGSRTAAANSGQVKDRRFLTPSCHEDVSVRARSRTVTTTCTSRPGKASTAVCACLAPASDRCSSDTSTAGSSTALTPSTMACHAPRIRASPAPSGRRPSRSQTANTWLGRPLPPT